MHIDTPIQLVSKYQPQCEQTSFSVVFISIKNCKRTKRSKEHLVLIEAAFLNPRKIASGIQNIFAGW